LMRQNSKLPSGVSKQSVDGPKSLQGKTLGSPQGIWRLPLPAAKEKAKTFIPKVKVLIFTHIGFRFGAGVRLSLSLDLAQKIRELLLKLHNVIKRRKASPSKKEQLNAYRKVLRAFFLASSKAAFNLVEYIAKDFNGPYSPFRTKGPVPKKPVPKVEAPSKPRGNNSQRGARGRGNPSRGKSVPGQKPGAVKTNPKVGPNPYYMEYPKKPVPGLTEDQLSDLELLEDAERRATPFGIPPEREKVLTKLIPFPRHIWPYVSKLALVRFSIGLLRANKPFIQEYLIGEKWIDWEKPVPWFYPKVSNKFLT